MSRYSRSVGTSDRVYKAEVDELSSEPSKTHELLKDLAKGPFSKDELEQFRTVHLTPESSYAYLSNIAFEDLIPKFVTFGGKIVILQS